MRRLVIVAPLSAVLLVALYGCRFFGPPKGPPQDVVAEGPRIGDVAPDIAGEDIEGTSFRLRDYRGKVVVIDFWANW
jgi:cytochrome oxidase Cu insertion factor (SCO1/SenC/PrrC family)